jgi:hypothetical protein
MMLSADNISAPSALAGSLTYSLSHRVMRFAACFRVSCVTEIFIFFNISSHLTGNIWFWFFHSAQSDKYLHFHFSIYFTYTKLMKKNLQYVIAKVQLLTI